MRMLILKYWFVGRTVENSGIFQGVLPCHLICGVSTFVKYNDLLPHAEFAVLG